MRLKILTISLLLFTLSACTLPWSPPEEMQPDAIPPEVKEPITLQQVGETYDSIRFVSFVNNSVVFVARQNGKDHVVIDGVAQNDSYDEITSLMPMGEKEFALVYKVPEGWKILFKQKTYGPYKGYHGPELVSLAKTPERFAYLDYNFLPSELGEVKSYDPAALVLDDIERIPYSEKTVNEYLQGAKIDVYTDDYGYFSQGGSSKTINGKRATLSQPDDAGWAAYYDSHPILITDTAGVLVGRFACASFHDINGRLYFVASPLSKEATECKNWGLYREP